jgi:hypothetical protein
MRRPRLDVSQGAQAPKQRTHRHSPSWWIGFLLFGMLVVVIFVLTVVQSATRAISGELSLLGYAGLLLAVVLLLPTGLALLVTPFVVKVVVSPQELEYHTLAYILRVKWEAIESVVRTEFGAAGAQTLLVPLRPIVVLRWWARFAPWDVQDAAASIGVPISMFGGFRGGNLKADLRRFAPHLVE